MTRNPLTIDIALAVLAATIVLIVTSGAAEAGLIALIVLIFSVVSFVRQSRKRHRLSKPDGRRAQPVARAPRRPPRRY